MLKVEMKACPFMLFSRIFNIIECIYFQMEQTKQNKEVLHITEMANY